MKRSKGSIQKIVEFYEIRELNSDNLAILSSYEQNGSYILFDENETLPTDPRIETLSYTSFHALKLLMDYVQKGHKEAEAQFYRCLYSCVEDAFSAKGNLKQSERLKIILKLIQSGLLKFVRGNQELANKFDMLIDSYRSISNDNPAIETFKNILLFTDGDFIKEKNESWTYDRIEGKLYCVKEKRTNKHLTKGSV